MLPLKNGYCNLCNDGILKPLISGSCKLHYWANLRRSTAKPQRHYVRIADRPEDQILDWYQQRINEMAGRCMECGEPISIRNTTIAISSVAHILPKEHFDSIKQHPLNWLELGAPCGCHSQWDKSWESAAKMAVFPIALKRFSEFIDCIARDELKRIPACFR